ncbi:hypothetical protein AB2T63_19205 [Clostridium butyricum]|uniref:hypothetical protein n=1 Tax=Clostridium butyricum TaxID=1492 RepID=UPI0034670352
MGKIYVFSIRANNSGGSETLHQLVDTINNKGGNAFIVYPDSNETQPIPKFEKYNVKITSNVEDSPNNTIIVPETETQYLYKYCNMKKIIWWLSRDFYSGNCSYIGLLRSAERHGVNKIFYPIYIPLVWIKKKLRRYYFKFGKDKNEIFHFYNCKYVYDYLIKNGVKSENTMYLCGPIRIDFLNNNIKTKKENIIVYNPKKGISFTKKVIEELNKEKWIKQIIPLENMTPKEVANTLSRAKVYIDFGSFPGPERIPRESVLLGCNIITSNNGSAANDIDVPIPRNVKYDTKIKNIPEIVKKIYKLMEHYDQHICEYDIYREKIKAQSDIFRMNILSFFIKSDNEI